jgi:uncharacterized protein YgiB involved in biofilm formation
MQKRGQISNLSRFRKHRALKPLALAVSSVLLASCSTNQEEVYVVETPEDCTYRTSMSYEQCEVAYKKALAEAERTGPRYDSAADCAAEFGNEQCHQSSSGSFFMPFMAGWMVSSMMNNSSRQSMFNPVYKRQADRGNSFTTATGRPVNSTALGKFTAPSDAVRKPAPTANKTLRRGGFGAMAASKSAWSGSSKSWGG